MCEECGEWYHFLCVRLIDRAVKGIQQEVSFICLYCNDRTDSRNV